MSVLRAFAAFVSLASLVGCGSDDPPSNANNNTSGTTATCATDARVKPYAAGLEAKSSSGKLIASIVSATPSPPQRGAGAAGMNTWTVRLTLDGAPATGDILVTAEMPDHGHASPKAPKATANGDGTYNVDPLFFFMGGVWEIAFTSGTDRAMYSLCVE